MLEVEHGGDVQRGLAGVQRAVALDVAGHAVDDVSQGYAGVGVVRVVVDDRGRVDGAGARERPEALVPVDVTGELDRQTVIGMKGCLPREIQVNAVLDQEVLEGSADIRLVR